MNVLQHNNLSKFLACFPKIKKTIKEWSLINISLSGDAEISVFSVTKNLWDFFKDTEGDLLICNSREILALVKTGKNADIGDLQKKLQSRFPGHGFVLDVVETTKDGLMKIEMRFQNEKKISGNGGGDPQISLMLRVRQQRKSNVILIADDDLFMRSLVVKAMEPHGSVVALEDGANVVDTYLKILPDLLFLDIHLPVQSGSEILKEILIFDQDAYIVMLSADSAKENVINSRTSGAKGFIAKPFTKEKLEEALWRCPTITRVKTQ